jgi:hypothetical protein
MSLLGDAYLVYRIKSIAFAWVNFATVYHVLNGNYRDIVRSICESITIAITSDAGGVAR